MTRTMVLRVASLALLLLLVLVGVLATRWSSRLPDMAIYLARSEATTFTLERVHRRSGANGLEAQVTAMVAALAAGPTPEEAARGLSSVVPAGTRVLSARVERGLLTVDLSREVMSGGGSASMAGRLAQLSYTLTQPAGVEALALEVEGGPATLWGGEGLIADWPWRRPAGGELPWW